MSTAKPSRTSFCPRPFQENPRESSKQIKTPFAEVINLPVDIKLWRDGKPTDYTTGRSNVPVYHRYQELGVNYDCWGYDGRGPHALAKDILIWCGMKSDEAEKWSSDFVIDFLDFLPGEGATIPRSLINQFIGDIRAGKAKRWDEREVSPTARSRRRKRQFLAKGGF